jgi:nicotinamidase-related amidase
MPENPTLRMLSGLPAAPASLAESTLVMVDLQNTYTRGVMELEGVQAALDEAAALLDRARTAAIPVIHVQHDSGLGSPYDVTAEIGAIVDRVAPRDDEPVVVKSYPNAFTETELLALLSASPGRDLVLAGFMTHMCISSTARGAFSLGYRPTVVSGATATRALPGPGGQTVSAVALQAASLASITDLFGLVVPATADLPD